MSPQRGILHLQSPGVALPAFEPVISPGFLFGDVASL